MPWKHYTFKAVKESTKGKFPNISRLFHPNDAIFNSFTVDGTQSLCRFLAPGEEFLSINLTQEQINTLLKENQITVVIESISGLPNILIEQHVCCLIDRDGEKFYGYIPEQFIARLNVTPNSNTQPNIEGYSLQLMPRLKYLYSQGVNIMQHLKTLGYPRKEAIALSHEVQAGTYIAATAKGLGRIEPHVAKISQSFLEHFLPKDGMIIKSILFPDTTEEGVIWSLVVNAIQQKGGCKVKSVIGLCDSFSKVSNTRQYCASHIEDKMVKQDFAVTNPSKIPLPDNSVSYTFTSHSMDPYTNDDAETMLKEMWRVTKNGIIIFEISYDKATEDGKKRIEMLGYRQDDVRNMIKKLNGANIIHSEFMGEASQNPLNPEEIIVVEKKQKPEAEKIIVAEENKDTTDENVGNQCPFSDPLYPNQRLIFSNHGSSLFAKDSLVLYPIVDGIPILKESIPCTSSHPMPF